MRTFDLETRAYLLLAREGAASLPSPLTNDMQGQLYVDRESGPPDQLKLIRLNAAGTGYEAATLFTAIDKLAASQIDASAITSGSFLKVVAGALTGSAQGTRQVAFGSRSNTGSNVTSTTGASITDLAATVTLASGWTWDMFFFGSVNGSAPSGQTMTIGATIDNGSVASIFGPILDSTVVMAAPFFGYRLGVAGDGATHQFLARAKVSGGTGVVYTGACLLIALPSMP